VGHVREGIEPGQNDNATDDHLSQNPGHQTPGQDNQVAPAGNTSVRTQDGGNDTERHHAREESIRLLDQCVTAGDIDEFRLVAPWPIRASESRAGQTNQGSRDHDDTQRSECQSSDLAVTAVRHLEHHTNTKTKVLPPTIPEGRRGMTTVTGMITSYDDYPIHQTSEPIAHTDSGDPNHYDRYFFNGYSQDGSVFFAAAMGLYPNRHVMDASFSVVHKGEQVNVHSSARAPQDRALCTTVGPISINVVRPLQEHRLMVEAPEHGLRADLTYHASSMPYEEPPFLTRGGNRTTMRYTRLTQLGSWEGWLEIDGQRIVVGRDAFKGSRDRSWGVRGIGERIQTGAPLNQAPQFFWLWAPVCFDSFGTVFDVNEYEDGQRWHESGAMLVGSDTVKHAHSVDYRYRWEVGTRRSTGFELNYSFSGSSARLEFSPLVHFQMLGLGYLHPEWSHGVWKGENEVGGERFAVPVADPMLLHHLHTQTLCSVVCTLSDGTVHNGTGVLETLVLGAHQPSGFTGVIDGYSVPHR
jgi:hypothetical protein